MKILKLIFISVIFPHWILAQLDNEDFKVSRELEKLYAYTNFDEAYKNKDSVLRLSLKKYFSFEYKHDQNIVLPFDTLPDELYSFKNLRFLELPPQTKFISKKISKLENLEGITLGSRMDAKEAFSALINNKKLKYLKCNGFKEIPPEIGKIISLIEIDLSYNDINILPKEFSNLTSLEILNLWYNDLDIKQVLSVLKLCPNLKELDLANCNISKLPNEIGELKNLIILQLGNGIIERTWRNIDTTIKDIDPDPQNNIFTSIPKSISLLTKLRILYLWGSKINESEFPEIKKLLPNTIIQSNERYW